MNKLALSVAIATALLNTAIHAQEVRSIAVLDVYSYPRDCPKGEQSREVLEVYSWDEEYGQVSLRPSQTCVPIDYHWDGVIFIAPDGWAHDGIPHGQTMLDILRDFQARR